MTGLEWILVIVVGVLILAYHQASLQVFTLGLGILLGLMTSLSDFSMVTVWIVFFVVFGFFNIIPLRRQVFSRFVLYVYRKVMPTMSRTEREALMAGSVGWEGELFRGLPQWDKLRQLPVPMLNAEEQAFFDGPVQELCNRIDDWDITHKRADLPPELWQFLKEQGFFGLIIPKKFGGKGFSAFAHSEILIKLYGVSGTVASTVSVPNSLGPAELLLHYGTKQQQDYYLPRLAKGEDIPCFALTGPSAGSDAGAIPDKGIVTWGEHEGKKVLGIRLTFDKRYITLAPVATIVGLAFKLYDPDHLIGKKENLGITCALIPRDTPNMQIGRRHFPLNLVFQNGPVHGKDVFIPLDWIIGGVDMAGRGWQMLMECLAAGRAISLPASSVGGGKMLSFATGAYARIRRQFNIPIGRFEGVEEALARIIGHTYIADATRTLAAVSIDQGEKPAIASAITKYHVTELGRKISNDAMDIHGGKGICLGPKNYLGRGYESVPISITVEGANILTRSLIIFGQGAMRCHPYIFAEFEAANLSDPKKRLRAFDAAFMGHMRYTGCNKVRTLVTSLTSGFFIRAPRGETKRFYQQASRFSTAFALLADVCLLILGGSLKRKESLSGRLGDILSYLYMLSAVLKKYEDQGAHKEDLPLLRWSVKTCLYEIQNSFADILQNFPIRIVAWVMHFYIFPFGKNFKKPSDKLTWKLANLALSPTPTKARVTSGIFIGEDRTTGMALVQDALLKTIASEPIEKDLRAAMREDTIEGDNLAELADAALKIKMITAEQYNLVLEAEEARKLVISVDDFSTEDLQHREAKKG